MFNKKRLTIALLVGLLCGVSCFIGGKYLFNLPFGMVNFWFILLNRMMIGFVIGTSVLRIQWAVHGLLIGFVVGSIFAYADFMAGFPGYVIFLVVLMNLFFGFIIEFFTSVVFKQPLGETAVIG